MPVTLCDGAPSDVLPAQNIDIVREVKWFVVENLRTARRFLKRCDREINIDLLTFAELNEHTPAAEIPKLLDPMRQGHDMAVMSEAGCPAIADPGADLVAVAQREGFDVVPLVGPSSILLGLMGSGFNGQSFCFNGYLPIDEPRRGAKLREMMNRINRERQTQIFIETPYRNTKLIAELVSRLPAETLLAVGCNLTSPTQSIVTRPLYQWAATDTAPYAKVPCIFLLFN